MNIMFRAAVVFAATGVCLGSAGCSPSLAPPPEPAASTQPKPATPSGATAEPGGGVPTAAPGPHPADRPVAVRSGALDKTVVTAFVYPVRRSGRTATANVLIKSEDPDEEFTISTTLGDGNPEVSARSLDAVDGIRLIDSAAKKAYLPATTGDGVCLCSPTDDAVHDYSTATWVTVVFAAPPETTSRVDFLMPVFGTVTDVPVA